jgi:hypothetical protein
MRLACGQAVARVKDAVVVPAQLRSRVRGAVLEEVLLLVVLMPISA